MSEIKNGGLDQYGAEPFEQQQFGTAGIDCVNVWQNLNHLPLVIRCASVTDHKAVVSRLYSVVQQLHVLW